MLKLLIFTILIMRFYYFVVVVVVVVVVVIVDNSCHVLNTGIIFKELPGKKITNGSQLTEVANSNC